MAICPNGHDSASDDFCDICGMRIAGSPSPGSVAGTGSPAGPGNGGYGPAGNGGYGPAGSAGPSGRPGSAPSPAMGMPGPGPGPGAPGAGDPCPRCGTPRVGQFCEACGYKFGAAQPPWPSGPHAPPPASGLSSSPQPRSAPWPPPSAQSVPSRSSAPSVPTAQPVSPTRPVPPSQYAPVGWTAVVSCDRAYFESVQAASGPEAAAVSFPSYYAERRFRLTGSQMRIGRRSVSRGIDPEIDLTGPPADPGISRLHAVLIAMPDGSWTVLDPGSANGTLVNGAEVPTGVQVPLRDGDRINLGAWTAIAVHRG
jgi:FHA domain